MNTDSKKEILNGKPVPKRVMEQVLGIRVFNDLELPRQCWYRNQPYEVTAAAKGKYVSGKP